MQQYRHGDATIRVHGNACRATIEKATIVFLKKVELSKSKQKEQYKHGNTDKSRNI